MIGGKLLAIIIIVGAALVWLKGWSLVILGIFALLWIIRWLADLYWWMKDNGKI